MAVLLALVYLLVPGSSRAHDPLIHRSLPGWAWPGDTGSLPFSRRCEAVDGEDLTRFRRSLWELASSLPDEDLRRWFLLRWPTARDFDATALAELLSLSPTARIYGIDRGGEPDRWGAVLSDASAWPDLDSRNRDRLRRDPSGAPALDAWARPQPIDPAILDLGQRTGPTSQDHAHFQLWPGEHSADRATLAERPWAFASPADAHSFGADFAQSWTDMALLASLWDDEGGCWLSATFAGAALHHSVDAASAMNTLQVGGEVFAHRGRRLSMIEDLRTLGGLLDRRWDPDQATIHLLRNVHAFADALWLAQLHDALDGNDPQLAAELRRLPELSRPMEADLERALSRIEGPPSQGDFARQITLDLARQGGPDGARLYQIAWLISSPALKSARVEFGDGDDPRDFLLEAGPGEPLREEAMARFLDVQQDGMRRAVAALRLWGHLYSQRSEPHLSVPGRVGAAERVLRDPDLDLARAEAEQLASEHRDGRLLVLGRLLRDRRAALDAERARREAWTAPPPPHSIDLTLPLALLGAVLAFAFFVRSGIVSYVKYSLGAGGPAVPPPPASGATPLLLLGAGLISLLAASPAAAASPFPHQRFLQQAEGLAPFGPEQVIGPTEQQLTSRPRGEGGPIVMGYLPYWVAPENIPWGMLDVLAWFSVGMNADGSLGGDHGWGDAGAQAVIDAAHQVGAVVVLSVTRFGGSELAPLLGGASARANAIDNLVQAMLDGGGDGIDVDFEGVSQSNRQDMIDFVTDLRAAMTLAQPGSHLSLATPAVDWSSAWDYDVLAAQVDVLFIMGYAFAGTWSDPGPNAPLAGSSQWGGYSLQWSAQDYISYGGAENGHKVVLGLPLYGHTWEASSDQIGASATGSAWSTFYDECQQLFAEHGSSWDADSATPWTAWQAGGWRQLWCEDAQSMALKATLARDEGLGGFGFWALNYDGGDATLWDALGDVVSDWEGATGDDDDTVGDDDDAVGDDDDDTVVVGEVRIEGPSVLRLGESAVYQATVEGLSGEPVLDFVWSQRAGPETSLDGWETSRLRLQPGDLGSYELEVAVFGAGAAPLSGSVGFRVLPADPEPDPGGAGCGCDAAGGGGGLFGLLLLLWWRPGRAGPRHGSSRSIHPAIVRQPE